MKPEVVEGARNLRAILTSDARPAILAGLNLSQEELMLRLCNDVMDADLEVKGLEERLRHTSPEKLAAAEAALAREKEIGAELSKQVSTAEWRATEAGRKLLEFKDEALRWGLHTISPENLPPKLQAFTPLAAALAKSPWKERRKKPKKKAKR